MQTYMTIKSIVMALALIGAFGYFFVRARHLYRLMRSVEGQTDFKLDRIGERIKILFHLENFDEAFRQLGKFLKSKKPTLFELWKAGDMYERASHHKDRSSENKLKDLKKALKCYEKCLKIPGASDKLPKMRFSIKRVKDRVAHLEREINVKS